MVEITFVACDIVGGRIKGGDASDAQADQWEHTIPSVNRRMDLGLEWVRSREN
jgi:hypothetical protein